MAEATQVCERIPGQDTCPFHPSHKITSVCKTCGDLVCLECIMSKEHKEHEFKKISECLREPTNAIAKHLTNIDKNLLVSIERDLDAVKSERKKSIQKHTESVQSIEEQGTNLKREIDSSTSDMVVQMGKHLQEVLGSLDNHTQVLESLRKYLLEEQKECTKVLQDGSEILKFDVGNAVIDKADKTKIPEHPNISDVQHIKCENSENLIKKALGALQEIQHPEMSPSNSALGSTEFQQTELESFVHFVPTLTTGERKKTHKYSSITTQSTWTNEDPHYIQISPVTNDTAWAGNYNQMNLLHLISSTGKSLREIQTDRDFTGLSVHPTTGKLYVGITGDNTIASIDTESGRTSDVVQCAIKPDKIIVTRDNDVLVGTWDDENPVYRYKLKDGLVHRSPENYNLYDIDQCARTNRVVVSCGSDGVMILNNNLTKLHKFTGLTGGLNILTPKKKFEWRTSIFDTFGNLIVGDYINKKVFILDGYQYKLIQKVPVKDMSNPQKLKLYNNILWVQCLTPGKVMYIEMK